MRKYKLDVSTLQKGGTIMNVARRKTSSNVIGEKSNRNRDSTSNSKVRRSSRDRCFRRNYSVPSGFNYGDVLRFLEYLNDKGLNPFSTQLTDLRSHVSENQRATQFHLLFTDLREGIVVDCQKLAELRFTKGLEEIDLFRAAEHHKINNPAGLTPEEYLELGKQF